MLTRKLHIRGLSRITARLMTVLFAVQIVVGGFCLMSADVHAMPQAMMSVDMQIHCAQSAHDGVADQHESDHSGNCYHCDQPDELSASFFTSVAPMVLVLSDVITLPDVPQFGSAVTGMFSTRTPTGPPRSSSLLYTITQRIRV